MKKRWPKFIVLTMALLLLGGVAASASAANNANSTQSNVLCQGLMLGKQKAQTALNVVADLTGLSTANIRSQRLEGKSLAEIAEAKGISEQTVIDKAIAERTAALDQLKADKKITDAQYQNCINNMESRIKANIERTATGGGNGKQGAGCMQGYGRGQGIGRGCGYNQANSQNI
ncbi:MAG TPA: hypothetical protein VHQ70_06810 [Syntrophomonadaceae bacterium]|nr:hypothetical protein [Syntrophomonadaceae bacterium]